MFERRELLERGVGQEHSKIVLTSKHLACTLRNKDKLEEG